MKMNVTPRKRQSSSTNATANSKIIKIDPAVKENIPPPDFIGVINSYESNVNLHDIRTKITTPKKSRGNLKEQPVTPSSNVKLLANVAADCEYVECDAQNLNKNDEVYDQISCDSDSLEMATVKINRKEKSLAVICSRFLAIYPEYPSPNEKIIVSLDEICLRLAVERRRLYDIVNVLESIDIVTKNAKNQYLWFGKNHLFKSLRKLQDAAIKEKMLEKLQYVLDTDDGSCKQSCILSEVQNFNKAFETPDSPVLSMVTSSTDSRKEKSLGLMSQKFLMLFLVSENKVISLGVAAKVLNGFLPRNEKPSQIKTQVRRLYDVANVLSSIGLIQKENAFSHCVRKPAFKYIGPDLKNFTDNNIDYVLKFQDIVKVAELEHRKLNMKEFHDSPSTESKVNSISDNVKTSFENLQLTKDANSKFVKDKCPLESKPNVTTPVFIQPNLKLVNVKSSEVNPSVPCYIINNISTDKSEVKNSNMFGTQTFLLLNPIAPSKQLKVEPPLIQSNNKDPNQQIITLSPEQRDAILQSLNISLSSQQVAAIHLDGASQSNSQEVPYNVLKIFNKSHATKVSEEKNAMKISVPKDFESNSINKSRSNTPNSSETVGSPLSIPSGYVTPIPNISSDISFISNTEVRDILKNIENHSKLETLSNKLTISRQESEAYAEMKINPAKVAENAILSYQFKKSVTSLDGNSKNEINSSFNQANQLISNDSCSSDSINLEVSNILKGKNTNDTLVKSKPFLIDEKTLLSPIKTRTPAQILVPSTLISPPHIVPETVFVFNPPSTSYQTTRINNIPNIVKVVPNILSKQKSNVFIKLDSKE